MSFLNVSAHYLIYIFFSFIYSYILINYVITLGDRHSTIIGLQFINVQFMNQKFLVSLSSS